MSKSGVPKLIISIGICAAIIVAIITYSIAWFSSKNTAVTALQATYSAQGISSFIIETQTDEAYGRYMGQTGTQYDGPDYPYSIRYAPFIVNIDTINEDSVGSYFTYRLTEYSKIKYIIAGSTPLSLTPDDCWDNFSMELRHIEYNEETEEYEETGDRYVSENGYFRNVDTGRLLSFVEDNNQNFNLYIYFQGDVKMKMLADTQDDIANDLAFDYCDEEFMFATFVLSSIFNLEDMHTLIFNSDGYDVDAENALIEKSDSPIYRVSSTGFNLLTADGVEQQWPVGEIYSGEAVDYSYYFKDWAYVTTDPETSELDFAIYRPTSTTSSINKLSTAPLREDNTVLNAVVGESPVLTLDLNLSDAPVGEGEVDPDLVECYMRPKSTYYNQSSSLTYNYSTQTITITNPTSVNGAVSYVTTRTIPAPQKEGYFFVGWSGTETPSYSNGTLIDPFTQGTLTIEEDTTLYAIFKPLVYVNLNVPTTWGSNYATIQNISITQNETPVSVTNGNVRLAGERNTQVYDLVSLYSATANAKIGNVDRPLTLKGWKFNNGTQWVILTESNSYLLTEETTLYAEWNERKTYTIKLDLYETLKATALSSTTATYSSYTVNTAVEVEHYSIFFNGNLTGKFTDNNDAGISVSNIPEGATLTDIGLNNNGTGITVEAAESPLVKRYVDFERWEITNNNFNTPASSHHGTAVSLTTAISDTFLDTLTDNTIYAFFDYLT